MAPYFEILINRSDGVIETPLKGKKVERNEPTKEQLDQTPDATGVCDFYKAVPPGDAKEIEWRRKLGGMLMRQLGNEETEGKLYILAALPDNYRLFEHLKYTKTEDGETAKPSRTHARGGNDRQDAYLYGHPMGRKKRYRCPADFFNHLLWLATDSEGNPDNCTCKICCPEDIPQSAGGVANTASSGQKNEDRPSQSKKSQQLQQPQAIVPKKNATSQKVSQKSSIKPASPAMTGSAQPPSSNTNSNNNTSSTPSPMHSREQALDAEPDKFRYRPGEVVWFDRGNAWGLSVIIKRELFDAGDHHVTNYHLQPLSHPYIHPQQVTINNEYALRPWLAWSAPDPTHAAINGSTYDTADWMGVLQGRYGQGDAEVDGSILAARAVDETYTLFDQLSIQGASPNSTYWKGIFLGCEKIWVGEPIRLRSSDPNEIMIVEFIVESTSPGAMGSVQQDSVILVGDRYTYVTTKTDARPPNDSLPLRMRADLDFRNAMTQPTRGETSYWKLVQRRTQIGLGTARGRWYESGLFLPILQGHEAFEAESRKGNVRDVGSFMNGRCDAPMHGNKVGFKRADRAEAFGGAIPRHVVISRGLDATERDPGWGGGSGGGGTDAGRAQQPSKHGQQMGGYMPAQDTTQQLAQGGGTGAPTAATTGVGDMEQFVNLDHGMHDGNQYFVN